MDKAVNLGVVDGLKVGREEVPVSHLQFADNILFFLGHALQNIRNVSSF